MNEKKKGFNLFPEYVWMIFVGMLLAILILSNIIPGHAGEITPVAGSNSVAFSYESPDHPKYVYTCPFSTAVMLDSQGYYNWLNPPQKVYGSDDYGVNYTSVINSTRFSNDVKLIKGSVGFDFSGTSLIHVSKANYTGYLPGSVQESWYEDFQEAGYNYFGCDLWAFPGDDISSVPKCIGYIIIKFSDNEIPVLSKVNRVYDQEFFQVDFDESKVVETLTYFNQYAWYVWGFDFPSDADFWASGNQVIYDGLYDHSVENHRIYVKTVNRGDFYFNHVSYNEQYALNYKYRANVECLDLHREADPEEPEPETFYFKFSASDYYGTYYYMVSFEASDLGISRSFPVNDSFISYIANQESFNPSDFSGSAFVYRSGMSSTWNQPTYEKPALAFYFTSSGYSNFKLYSIPNATAYEYEPEVIAQTYSPTDVGSSGYVRTYDYSYTGVSCFLFSQEIRYNNNYRYSSYALGSVYGFDYTFQDVYSTAAWYSDGSYYNLDPGVQNKINFAYYGFLGLLGKLEDVDNPNGPTPLPEPTATPDPTSTPVPLPTSGESIHVILPTGTPTPTPPFTVSGGLDGGSGSGSGTGSPGSIGSGLSSGQTSGVLQAWQLYVSDNPAMIFLTSTFQSLPQELLYPLYILLFILLLLAVIRLFVHFSGG